MFQEENLFEEGEVVVMKVKRHWITYVQDVLIHFFGVTLFLGIALLATFFKKEFSVYAELFFLVLVLLGFVSFFYAWTKNYFDVWYVTDRRIIAVDQKEILRRTVDYLAYSRIQDVMFEKNGFLETFFGYGKLRVENAGEEQETEMLYVTDVEEVAKKIMELRDGAKEGLDIRL
jgi:uncharacterized membrane protein YdbT with pleckstrin-like domain